MNIRLNDEELGLLACAKELSAVVRKMIQQTEETKKILDEEDPLSVESDQAIEKMLNLAGTNWDDPDHQYKIFMALLPIFNASVPAHKQTLYWQSVLNPNALSLILGVTIGQVGCMFANELLYKHLYCVNVDQDGWVTGFNESDLA